jgi:hypothetical protein
LADIYVAYFYIVAYYANFFPGDSFENFIYITIVERISYIVADFTFERLGDHPSAKLFVASFIISMIDSIGILSIDPTVYPYQDLTFNYIAKFGVGVAFKGVFLSTTNVFPVIFASTTFGICNMMGTISAFFSIDVYLQ